MLLSIYGFVSNAWSFYYLQNNILTSKRMCYHLNHSNINEQKDMPLLPGGRAKNISIK